MYERTGTNTPARVLQWAGGLGTWVSSVPDIGQPSYPAPDISQHSYWLVEEERHAYMEATVEQDIAFQIESNRRARGMSQADLAKAIGTRQSAIARLEDSTYGRHSLATLMKVAHAFDCALRVSLISYSRLAEEVADTSDDALYAAPFESERALLEYWVQVNQK